MGWGKTLGRCGANFLMPIALGLLTTCSNILPGAGSSGKCTVGDTVVDTYSIFGTWKKIKGYSPERTTAQLELNYDVLLVLTGKPICRVAVENGAVDAAEGLISNGTYVHNISDKTIDVTYTLGDKADTTETIKYSFVGSCDSTKMTLTYEDSSTEVFQYRSKDTSSLSCGS